MSNSAADRRSPPTRFGIPLRPIYSTGKVGMAERALAGLGASLGV